MKLFGGLEARPRVAVSGALRLARILPIIKVLRTPFAGDLDAVIAGCVKAGDPGVNAAVESLRAWRSELDPSNDIWLPNYYRATALAVGLLIAAPEALEPNEQFDKINANVGNFWNCCDHIVHKAGGFQSPELRSIKSTLHGVENQWFDGDVELLTHSTDPQGVLRERLLKISEKVDMRRAVAMEFVKCARWNDFM
jgi:hypothetical protein